ncbi:MAG: hypothetical protein ACYDDO_04920 [Acidiferrobacterales bacterium]
MDRPHFDILVHPSRRLLGNHETYDVDMLRIIRTARKCGGLLELNAHADRLDLLETQCQMARMREC